MTSVLRAVPDRELDAFITALRTAHATTPDTARTLDELPAIPAERLQVFLAAELVRESAPGAFYAPMLPAPVSVWTVRRPYTPARVALMMAIWIVALFVPLVVWLLAR